MFESGKPVHSLHGSGGRSFWSAGAVVVLASILMACPWAAGRDTRVDPQTGMIRILFMGDALMESGFVTPIIVQDPLVKLTAVPVEFITRKYVSIDYAAATLRMYLPRTEQALRNGYDMVIITDAREPFFPPKIQYWIKRGVTETGLGFLMAGGPQSFGGSLDNPSWESSPVGDILPCKCPRDLWDLSKSYHLVPVPAYKDHPLVRNIPWQEVFLFNHQRVVEKEGAVVVGRSDRNPKNSPILMYMDVGKGRSEAFVFDWGGNGPQDFHRWAYAPVVLSNLIYYSVGVKIPEDTTLFLRFRNKLAGYYSTRSFAISIIDFAEEFGANVAKANAELAAADDLRKQVIRQYVAGEYDNSLTTLDQALAKIKDVADIAMKAKDEALLWVYVIEWFTVSGTLMISASIVWALMVRRAAYREVGVTRFDR